MVRREDAFKQAARLSARRGFNDLGQTGIEELVRTLVDTCRDIEHAEAVITTWNRTREWVPQPSELWSLAEDFPAPRREYAGCKRCDGSGFMVTRFIRTRRPGQPKPTYDRLDWADGEEARRQWDALVDGQDIVETSGHCQCPKGQHLRTEALAAEARKADAVEQATMKQMQKKASWEARRNG